MAELRTQPAIHLYCDGSCLKPNEHGAWAYLAKFPDGTEIAEHWAVPSTTNNRMELAAVYYGLKRLEELGHADDKIMVYCDSQYVVKGVREWLINWKQRGWNRADGKPVKNARIWKRLDARLQAFSNLRFSWVRGHAGNEGNEIVDKMCHNAAKGLRDAG